MIGSTLSPGALAILQQGYRNNWQEYLVSIQGEEREREYWDRVILTASNERQADAYRTQLEARRRSGLLPKRTQFIVMPDPQGVRIGSGGATLHVLSELSRRQRNETSSGRSAPPFRDQRVLIIHSGGDSRRLPHCSASGKLFARVPHELPDGRSSSLFDEFLVSLSGLPSRIPEGVLVASGDVLLLFDHLQLSFSRPGVTGVAIAAPIETGTHHGIYVTRDDTRQVKSFLHKPSLQRMRDEGALLASGRCLIDTGLVWLDRGTIVRLLGLGIELEGTIAAGVNINLYGDLLAPLAETADYAGYLSDTSDGESGVALQAARGLIWQTLRGTQLSVESLQPAEFIHFGTTREYLQVLREGVEMLAPCGWTAQSTSWVASPVLSEARDSFVAINASCMQGSVGSAFAIDSFLGAQVSLGRDSFAHHVRTRESGFALEPNLVLDQLTLRGDAGYVSRLYGVEDDPKIPMAEGGLYLNRPWKEWLTSAPVQAEDLWCDGDTEETLWTARLYPIRSNREESLDLVLWLQHPETVDSETLDIWRTSERLSLGDSYVRADVERMVEEQSELEDEVRARLFVSATDQERPAHSLGRLIGVGARSARRAGIVADQMQRSVDPWLPIRGYQALAVATGDANWEDWAFGSLARLVRAHTSAPHRSSLADLGERAPVRMEAAARIDFGGGWSDTPPFSLERGGKVLNAAIALRNARPIIASAELLNEPVVELVSQDIGATIRPSCLGDILNYANPTDPFALPKAAVAFYGLVPQGADPQLATSDYLRTSGRGIRISTGTRIPRGSGLGTSSILAGVILQSLSTLMGRPRTMEQLVDEVLCLEQMITTGGGWQDQIGGLVGGIKLVTTEPGLPQMACIEPVQMTRELDALIGQRLRIVYTGQRRLAKNLLRHIMSRWMARDPEMVTMLHQIRDLAQGMHDALERSDLDTLGELVGQHWQVNKRMDPGSSNAFIDSLFELCDPYLSGAKLAGAGGGGFAIMIAKDADAAIALEERLRLLYPDGPVRMWESGIDVRGICESPI